MNKTLEIYFEGNKELDAKKILSVWDENLKIISAEKTVGPEAWLEMEDYYKTQIDGDMSKWSIDFEVKSIIQVIGDYIRKKRIRLDPSRNPKVVTLHDPCNLVRLGGLIEEQRFVLRQAVTHFVEMTPNREKNYCCGGGGGQLAMTRFAERRIASGKIKADQGIQTGAEVVVTPCHNCIDQFMELNKHYKLGVEIKTISEIVADALVIPEPV